MSMLLNKIKALWITTLKLLFPDRRSEKRLVFDFSFTPPYELAQKLSPTFQSQNQPSENHIVTCLSYNDPLVRTLVWHIKTKHDRYAFACAAHIMCEKLKHMQIRVESSTPIIIPIPIHKKRLRERGYNQCELLAQEIEKNFNIEIRTDILFRKYRKENAKKQAFKNRSERHNGIKDIFSVNTTAIKKIPNLASQHIIIIDDVITTGSTINEAILTLQNAGCKNISGLVLAH